MNLSLSLSACAALLLVPSCDARADEPSLAPATMVILVDCSTRGLPRQRDVGALMDQHNLGQVHASRGRLMSEVARACQRAGVRQVRLVPDAAAAASSALAVKASE